MSDFAFPSDLIRTQYALHQAWHELSAHHRTQPAWAERSRSPEADGWNPDRPPLGLTQEQYERGQELRARITELAADVHGHQFWASLAGEDLVAARDALKRTEGAVPDAGLA